MADFVSMSGNVIPGGDPEHDINNSSSSNTPVSTDLIANSIQTTANLNATLNSAPQFAPNPVEQQSNLVLNSAEGWQRFNDYMSNDTDAPVDQEALSSYERTIYGQQARDNVMIDAYSNYASKTSPEGQLHKVDIAATLDVPLTDVEHDPKRYSELARYSKSARYLSTHPELGSFIKENPSVFMAMQRGETDALSQVATTFGEKFGAGIDMAHLNEERSQLYQEIRNNSDMQPTKEQEGRLQDLNNRMLRASALQNGWASTMGNIFGALKDAVFSEEMGKAFLTSAGLGLATQGVIGAVGRGAGTVGVGAVEGIGKALTLRGLSQFVLSTAPTMGFAMYDYNQSQGRVFGDLIEQGVDPFTAADKSDTAATSNALLDIIGGGATVGGAELLKKGVSKLGTSIAGVVPQTALDTIANSLSKLKGSMDVAFDAADLKALTNVLGQGGKLVDKFIALSKTKGGLVGTNLLTGAFIGADQNAVSMMLENTLYNAGLDEALPKMKEELAGLKTKIDGSTATEEEQRRYEELDNRINNLKYRDTYDNVDTAALSGALMNTLISVSAQFPGLVADSFNYAQMRARNQAQHEAVAHLLDNSQSIQGKGGKTAAAIYNQMAQVLGLQNYHLDPTQLRDILAKDPVAATKIKAMLKSDQNIDLDSAINTAERAGQDIEISVGNMMAYFLNTDLREEFQNISSFGDSNLSDMEIALRVKQLPEEVRRLAESVEWDFAVNAQREVELKAIADDLRAQMRDAMPSFKDPSAGQLRANSLKIITAFIDRLSLRAGMTPKEFMEKHGVHYKQFSMEDKAKLGGTVTGQYHSDATTVFFNPNATVATVMHETAHWVLDIMEKLNLEDLKVVYDMLGTDEAGYKANREKFQEQFAYTFEQFLSQPSSLENPQARRMMNFIKQQMVTNYEISQGGLEGQYKAQTGEDLPPISSKITDFFNDMLFNKQLAQALDDIGLITRLDPKVMEKLPQRDRDLIKQAEQDIFDEALLTLDEGAYQQSKILTGKAKGILKKDFIQRRKELMAKTDIDVHRTTEQLFADITRYGYIINPDGTRTYMEGASRVLNRDAVRDILLNDPNFDPKVAQAIIDRLEAKHLLGEWNNSVDPRDIVSAFLSDNKSLVQFLHELGNTKQDSNETRDVDLRNANPDLATQFRYYLTYGIAKGKDGNMYKLFDKKKGINAAELRELLKKTKGKEYTKKTLENLAHRQLLGKNDTSYSVAEMMTLLGVNDITALLDKVVGMQSLEFRRNKLVKEGLLNEYKDLLDPKNRSDLVATMLATEAGSRYYMVLGRAFKKLGVNTRAMQKGYKAQAERMLRKWTLKELNPTRFTNAQRKALRLATRAVAKGDLKTAGLYLMKAALNQQLALRTMQIRKETARALRICKRLRHLDTDHFDTNFIRVAQYLQSIAMGTMTPEREVKILGGKLNNELPMFRDQPAAYARLIAIKAKNYPELKNMTIAQVEDFASELTALVTMARGARQMIVDGKVIEIGKVVGDFVDSSRNNNKTAKAAEFGTRHALTWWENMKSTILDHLWKTRTAESVMEEVYGKVEKGKRNALLHFTIDRIRKHSVNADNRIKQRDAELNAILGKLDLNSDVNIHTFILKDKDGKEISRYDFNQNRLGRGELFMLLLNAGNADNWKKTVLGGRTKNGGKNEIDASPWALMDEDGNLNDSSMQQFLEQLIDEGVITKDWFDAAQKIWDLFESEQKGLQQAYYVSHGKYYKPVPAEFQLGNLVESKFGKDYADTLIGGYTPIRYDDVLHDRGLDATVDDMMCGNVAEFIPDSSDGFLKDRVDGVFGAVSLDLKNLYNAFSKQIWYQEMQPTVQDINKVFTDPNFVSEMQRVMPGGLQVLKSWLANVAKRQSKAPSTDKFADRLSQICINRATMTIMTGNVNNVLQQLSGFQVAALKMHHKELYGAMLRFIAHPIETGREIAKMSAFMRQRKISESIRDYRLSVDRAKATANVGWIRRHTGGLGVFSYVMQTCLQGMIDNITWSGAFNDFMNTNAKNYSPTELKERAIEHADSVVADTQSSQRVEDLSQWQVNAKSWEKLFRMFTSYFIMLRNLQPVKVKEYESKGLPRNASMAAAFTVATYMPFLLGEAMAQYFRGTYNGQDGEEALAKTILTQLYKAPLTAYMPTVGSFAGALADKAIGIDTGFVGSKTQGPSSAAFSMVSNLVNNSKYLHDDKFNEKDVGTLIDLLTVTTGVPALELLKTPLKGAIVIDDGRAGDGGFMDSAKALISGKEIKK